MAGEGSDLKKSSHILYTRRHFRILTNYNVIYIRLNLVKQCLIDTLQHQSLKFYFQPYFICIESSKWDLDTSKLYYTYIYKYSIIEILSIKRCNDRSDYSYGWFDVYTQIRRRDVWISGWPGSHPSVMVIISMLASSAVDRGFEPN